MDADTRTAVAGADSRYDCDCCGTATLPCCLVRTRFAGMDTTACVACVGGDQAEEHAAHSELEDDDAEAEERDARDLAEWPYEREDDNVDDD